MSTESPVKDMLLHSQIIDFVSNDMERVKDNLNKSVDLLRSEIEEALRGKMESPYEILSSFNSSCQQVDRFKNGYLLALDFIKEKKRKIEEAQKIKLLCVSCVCKTTSKLSNMLGDSHETTVFAKFSPLRAHSSENALGT